MNTNNSNVRVCQCALPALTGNTECCEHCQNFKSLNTLMSNEAPILNNVIPNSTQNANEKDVAALMRLVSANILSQNSARTIYDCLIVLNIRDSKLPIDPTANSIDLASLTGRIQIILDAGVLSYDIIDALCAARAFVQIMSGIKR